MRPASIRSTQISQFQPANARRTLDRRSSVSKAYRPRERISEFTDTRECRSPGSAGMLPAIRGILPRTRSVFAKHSGDRYVVRRATKPPGRMPDAASKMRAPRNSAHARLSTCTIHIITRDLLLVTKFDLRKQDCVKGMSRLADESVDLVVTSPPYNLGISYSKYSDRQERRSYLAW